jgi:hypothetical protein
MHYLGLLGIEEKRTKLCFSGGSGDKLENGAEDMDGTIKFDGFVVLWE